MQLNSILCVLVIVWLGFCSLEDIRKKKIHMVLIGTGFLIIFIYSIIAGGIGAWSRICGISLGIILLILNPVTRGQIGLGDGLIVGALGLSLGFAVTSSVLMVGLFGAAILSLILLLFKRVSKRATIPFVPFLLIGFLGVLIL